MTVYYIRITRKVLYALGRINFKPL